MNISKILEYQKAHREYDAIEKEFQKNPTVLQYQKLKGQRKQIKAAYEGYVNEMNSSDAKLDGLDAKYSEIEKEIADVLNENLESLDDAQLNFYLKKLRDYQEEINSIDREVGSANRDKKDAQLNAKKIEENYANIDALYKNVQAKANAYANNEIMPKLNAAKAKIAECKDSMSESDAALYDTVKAEIQSSRVFVELNGENCSGCGIEVLPAVKEKVFTEGYAKCANCGRIIFFKQ